MADRCDHCSVRMDGLEVHADHCPTRGPELREENARLRAQLAERDGKYSDLLQSHHSLCGQVAELKEKVATGPLAERLAQWAPVVEAAKKVRTIRQEASREAGRLGVEFSYEKFRKEHEDACTALDVAVWKLNDWERKTGHPEV